MTARVTLGLVGLLTMAGAQGGLAGPALVQPALAAGERLAPMPVADVVIAGPKCTAVPVDWELVADFGSYVIRFCWKTVNVKGVAYGDYHRLGSGGGGLGGYLQTREFYCSVPADKGLMTPTAIKTFC